MLNERKKHINKIPLILIGAVMGVALALAVFGIWGINSDSFDEMDGLIPFFALVASAGLTALSALSFILLLIVRSRR